MEPNPAVRRRSPAWVRALPSDTLHAMAGRFQRHQRQQDLTKPQEWLWGALISELEYRHRTTLPAYKRCSCCLCVPPFDFDDEPLPFLP